MREVKALARLSDCIGSSEPPLRADESKVPKSRENFDSRQLQLDVESDPSS